ncbi:MAG: 30S ribosomal protein S21 [Bdellovibrionales bacterium]|jgi:small subunit ribosomal protein S21|nr:30S ribosomal protein S21 [Bdellovibrionales bacterium]
MASKPKSTIKVHVDERGGIERSLRKFKRLCESFGVVKEYRKRQEYKKPSVRLKEKNEAAAKRRVKTAYKSRGNSKF